MIRLLLAILLIPLVDLALLVWIARHTSLTFVLGLVLAGGLAGIWLFGWQRRAMPLSLRRSMNEGGRTGEALFSSLAVFLAAILLFIPGVLSDAMAVVLLVPPTRRWLYDRLLRRVFPGGGQHGSADFGVYDEETARGDRIVDVRVIEPKSREIEPE